MSKLDISQFKDIHVGDRCFIVGTGPSLNKTNLALLQNEIVFGCNTLYRGMADWKLKCKYYGVSDVHVLRNHHDGIAKLDTTVFLALYAATEYLGHKPKYKKLKPFVLKNRVEEGFSLDPMQGIHWGSTVVYDVGLHMAYYMGFDEVYLVGVDCDYSGEHHFDGGTVDVMVQGAAGKWERAWESYPQAKKAFEKRGGHVYNATVGGRLEIFDRVSLESLDFGDVQVVTTSRPATTLTRSQKFLVYAWYHHITSNVEKSKSWYHGLPYTWWHGMSWVAFMDELPRHIREGKEAKWNIPIREGQ